MKNRHIGNTLMELCAGSLPEFSMAASAYFSIRPEWMSPSCVMRVA
jgi:hypothetical protein